MERDASRFVFFPWLCCGGFFGPFCFIHSLTHSLPLVLLSFRLLLRSRFSRFSEGAKKKKQRRSLTLSLCSVEGKDRGKRKRPQPTRQRRFSLSCLFFRYSSNLYFRSRTSSRRAWNLVGLLEVSRVGLFVVYAYSVTFLITSEVQVSYKFN